MPISLVPLNLSLLKQRMSQRLNTGIHARFQLNQTDLDCDEYLTVGALMLEFDFI